MLFCGEALKLNEKQLLLVACKSNRDELKLHDFLATSLRACPHFSEGGLDRVVDF